MSMAIPTSMLIEDAALIREVSRIQKQRKDATVTKTAKDLLREKLTEIRLQGDPMSLVDKKVPVSSAT